MDLEHAVDGRRPAEACLAAAVAVELLGGRGSAGAAFGSAVSELNHGKRSERLHCDGLQLLRHAGAGMRVFATGDPLWFDGG